jgi:hypothetical protein
MNAWCRWRFILRPMMVPSRTLRGRTGSWCRGACSHRSSGSARLHGQALWRAAIRDDRLKLTAIARYDLHNNSCSHPESLNCFERFGNRLSEPDH